MKNETDKLKKAIELLARHEEVIGKLYSKYAKLLPEKPFWRRLAKDEGLHAQWFRLLLKNINDNVLELDQSYNPEAIWQSIERLKVLCSESKNHSLTKALNLTYQIENMMIENDFLADFSIQGPEEKRILRRLLKATEKHRELVKKKIKEVKK